MRHHHAGSHCPLTSLPAAKEAGTAGTDSRLRHLCRLHGIPVFSPYRPQPALHHAGVLFGDGAGAAVIALDENSRYAFDCGAQGDTEVLYCPKSYPNTNPFAESQSEQPVQQVHMEGRAVYSFAVHALSGCISRVSEAAGGFPQHYVCHQANARILQAAAKQLGEPMDKFFLDIADYGNTSAASIAIALDDCVRSGGIQRGESLILAGFGGGLSYGAAYLTF